MLDIHITKEHYRAGYKVCQTCQAKVHTLKPGCELPHELCETCGYSVVDREAYLQGTSDMIEGFYGS